MAFNREDLITWNELAPSLQAVIRALQLQLIELNDRLDIIRITKKLVHFNRVLSEHICSDHPHPNAANCLVRQPLTEYKVGDTVMDSSLPPYCVLECVQAGKTSSYHIHYTTYDGWVPDEEYEKYDTVEEVNTELLRLYSVLKNHIETREAHNNASDFLIRHPDKEYKIGAVVFENLKDRSNINWSNTATEAIKQRVLNNLSVTKVLEVGPLSGPTTKTGSNSSNYPTNTVSYPIPNATTLKTCDEECLNLLNRLDEHINNITPHENLNFLFRLPNTHYNKGDEVFLPNHFKSIYYLVALTSGTTGSTESKDLSVGTVTYNDNVLFASL